jgi:hypothetical protein
MKQLVFVILIFFVVLTAAVGGSSPVHHDPEEPGFIIFGSYLNTVSKGNTTRMYQLTNTHLLRVPNGFFNPLSET